MNIGTGKRDVSINLPVDTMLVDETQLKPEFLEAIGQPE